MTVRALLYLQAQAVFRPLDGGPDLPLTATPPAPVLTTEAGAALTDETGTAALTP